MAFGVDDDFVKINGFLKSCRNNKLIQKNRKIT